jgi:hypothetical protein
MIKASEANVAAAGNKTIVIPGHNLPDQASRVSNKAELASFSDMLVAARENVAKFSRAALSTRPLRPSQPKRLMNSGASSSSPQRCSRS